MGLYKPKKKTVRKRKKNQRTTLSWKNYNGGSWSNDYDTEIFVGADRKKWTDSVKKHKPFFIDIIADCFRDPFGVESKTIPMLLDTTDITGAEKTEEQELTYSGSLQLTWSLIGGIVYEYIYDIDTAKKNAPFTPTCDIDLPVCIPDVFYKEGNDENDDDDEIYTDILRINFDKVLDSTLFQDLVYQIINRLKKMDFSHLVLDELPPANEEYDVYDHGKIRIIAAEGSKRNVAMVSKKIQMFISVDGQYGEIADIMMKLEQNQTKINSSTCVVKKGHHDGIHRNIFYIPLEGLLISEIDALLNRFQLGNVKTENHIGRIRYILKTIVASGNTLQQQCVMMDTIRMLSKIARDINAKSHAKMYAGVAKKVLCKYKGQDVTVKDIFLPIARFAVLEKKNPWYVGIFPEII